MEWWGTVWLEIEARLGARPYKYISTNQWNGKATIYSGILPIFLESGSKISKVWAKESRQERLEDPPLPWQIAEAGNYLGVNHFNGVVNDHFTFSRQWGGACHIIASVVLLLPFFAPLYNLGVGSCCHLIAVNWCPKAPQALLVRGYQGLDILCRALLGFSSLFSLDCI